MKKAYYPIFYAVAYSLGGQYNISQMAAHTDQEANVLYPVSKLMDKGQLERVYDQAADWSKL